MTRVAFIIPEELSPAKNKKTSWLGGLNYYKNVIAAVYKLNDRKIEIVIFVNSDASDQFVEQFSDTTVVRSVVVDFIYDSTMKFRRPLKKAWLYLLKKLNKDNYLIENLLLDHDIDVYCYGDPLRSEKIKSISWVADFQHLHHPDFFSSQKEVELRHEHVNRLIRDCDRLILSSETALNDVKTYYTEFIDKARVLKFIPNIDPKIKLVSFDNLKEKYNIQRPYFYMPNQFWKHKNHRVVVNALKQIKKTRSDLLVLASGSLSDYRNISHIEELISDINDHDLNNNIRLLGVIPYIDVLSLIHHSLALINPSFSEGWSSTVEEAKQLKVPLILSDIPIHREQTAHVANTILFNPNDHIGLSQILMDQNDHKTNVLRSNVFEFQTEFEKNQLDFGSIYQDIVLQVVQNN